jgi:hypothetical protein
MVLLMPFKAVIIRRWEVGLSFALLTVAFVLGLWAISAQLHADQRQRTTRIELLQKISEDSCRSRHLLAEAIEKQNSVINAAEARAIAQTIELQQQIDAGQATDPYPPGVLDRALRNARRLVVDLDSARRLVRRADCRSVPQIPNS